MSSIVTAVNRKRRPMLHYKCLSCRTRLRASTVPTASVPDLCPRCGSLLEPVGDLTEVIGFRAIASADGAAVTPGISTQEQIAARIGDLATRRDQRAARDSTASGCDGSLDDPAAGAVALPRPGPAR